MNLRDIESTIAALAAADAQLQNNIAALQKFENLGAKLDELNKLNTSEIAQKISNLNSEELVNALYKRIAAKMTETDARINSAQIALQEAAQKLSSSAREINETQSGLMQLDNIAKSIQKVEDFNKSYRAKTWYAGIIAALFLGVFSGSALAYARSAIVDDATPWLDFAVANNAKIEKDTKNQEYYISIPQNSKYVGERIANGRYIIIFGPKQVQK
jgi:citrate lyase beta subunit